MLFVGVALAVGPAADAAAPGVFLDHSAPQQQARQRQALSLQRQATPAITLDFETGDLRGWTAAGNAFRTQPTMGDNSRARGAQPANHQGEFWVGTFENHPRGAERAGTAQGDRPQGTLTSAPFNVPAGTLSFLIGGGSSFETRVELVVLDQIEGSIRVAFASGNNSETMRRQTWDLGQWTERRALIRIVDESSGPWGHINVDDFRFSALEQEVPTRPEVPTQDPVTPTQPARTRVPGLVGGDIEAARQLLDRAGLKLGDVQREPSFRPAGTILRQVPQASTVVLVGSSVELWLAAPIPEETYPESDIVEVPNVVGRDEGAALEILKEGNLEGMVTGRRESEQPAGTVVAQVPAAGSRIAIGSEVELVTAIPIPVTVPDLVGQSEAAARRALQAAGLVAGEVSQRESTQPRGSVVAQSVSPGARVEQGSAIGFAVAVPVMRRVPNLVGQSEARARSRLESADLATGVVSRRESRDDPGVVLAQSVEAGSSVVLGAVVDLVVSEPMRAAVPDLIGQPEAQARRLLQAAELAVGAVTQVESRREPGIVVSQSERAGSRIVLGTPVDVVVSVPVTVDVPDLVGRSEQEARGLLEGSELDVGSTTQQESRQPVGSVLAQQPRAGSRVVINTTVDIVVAEPVTVLVPELVGQGQEEARQRLAAAELTAGGETSSESRQPAGTILTQGIEAGTRVVVGTPVDLEIAVPVRVTVPEVVGSNQADATAAVEAAELVVGQIDFQESSAAPGTVLTQSLNPGTLVQIGSAVNLLVAVVETVEVPEVVGSTVEEARRALVTGRLAVGTEEVRETRVQPEGTVLEQSRAAGSVAAVGTPVNLVVATPEIVIVPSIIGLSEEEAAAVIIGAGLVVGVVGEQLSIQPGGTVLEQAQAAGSQVVFGTPVAIQVARSRSVWALPTGLLLLAAVGGTVVARMRTTRRRLSTPRQEKPDEPPPIPDIRVRPVTDAGKQNIDGGPDSVAEVEIRLRPRVDPGVQEIESPDDLIAGERREDE